MKIIHYFRSPVGGIFRHVRDLLSEQAKAGHEVGIICDSTTGGDYEDQLFEKILPDLKLGLHRLPIPRSISPVDFLALIRSRKLISRINPDIVHSHSAKGGIHGRLVAKLAQSSKHKISTFYCPHGGAMHYDAGSIKGKIFFAAERFMERFTDSLIFVSDYERNAYHEKVGKPICAEAIVYNGLAEDEFDQVEEHNDTADFLYIGMMRDLKGPDVFLEALNIAREKTGENLTAMFVGDGPDKEAYIAQISNLGLTAAVSVHAAMPAREAFRSAKIVVVPSRAESMPYLVLEAIAGQRPIVATNVGGIPEIFVERTSELVKPGDPADLARKMIELLEDENRESAAAEFSQSLKKRFSLPVMAQTVDKVYQKGR